MNKTLVFVIPFGALPNYIFPAAAWAKKLMEKGYRIVWIKCNQAMDSTCVVHYTLKVEDKKANRHRICSWCRSYQNSVLEELGCDGYVLNPVDDSELLDFDLDLKKLSAYTLMFSYKCLSLEELEQKYPEELSRYEKMNRVLLTQFERLKSKIDFTNSQIIVFHSMYPYAAALGAWARQEGFAYLSFNLGYSLAHLNTSVSVTRSDIETSTMQLARYYEKNWKKLSYSPEDISRSLLHLESGLFKKDVKNYSLAKSGNLVSVADQLGLGTDKKFVILACGSSNDEIAGSEVVRESCFGSSPDSVFADQISWFKALVERYSHRDDVILILRPHPRELKYQDGGH
ncbi:MAG: hypothetical protein H3C47_09655, partial [Candidatus Cloacimonetes bacterium]|nr:hypothetical protein [Candidatus Cloacimonadota bacterium]